MPRTARPQACSRFRFESDKGLPVLVILFPSVPVVSFVRICTVLGIHVVPDLVHSAMFLCLVQTLRIASGKPSKDLRPPYLGREIAFFRKERTSPLEIVGNGERY